MALDQSLVGRTFPPTGTHTVTPASVARFAAATGSVGPDAGRDLGAVPPTYPIVLAFEAMQTFLDAVGVELQRIVHGEQRFAYVRPLRVGDVLTAQLEVASLRSIGPNVLVGTTSTVTDVDGQVVCRASATLVHRAGDEHEEQP
ncbi:MaoC family dehydratase N-terminal domain-containing protein [Nocardioides sp. Y6]|uniref:MaoC family dehydratase N-terminal domain-containing protein n=1 Tax=Nocardioides malaquae TaxID=2773426 RepID=A0ABR9RUW8_9ACTN|nr:MaoC family dehydratase N-terminal domain-containing protein [Nocardioides malaquae]MBE7325402.1 MaoC family dehydratase N-terminal domain-containing protein [Nocardioides malaquae]